MAIGKPRRIGRIGRPLRTGWIGRNGPRHYGSSLVTDQDRIKTHYPTTTT